MNTWRKDPKVRALLRALSFALVGALIGSSCAFLPPQWQKPCQIASKIVSVFGGR